MTTRLGMLAVLLIGSGCAYEMEPAEGAEQALTVTDRCEIEGFALLDGGDLVIGRARGGDSAVDGRWLHLGDGHVMTADPQRITCRLNGRTIGELDGEAQLDGTPGYTFRVFIEDHGEPGPPPVVEGTPEVRTLTATRTYRPSRWEDDGIEERARVTIPAQLPVTVGNAGNQWAWLTFQRHGTFDVVVCRYRGGAPTPVPRTPADLAAGERYHLQRCTGEWHGTDPVDAGSVVDARWLRLHVQTGAHFEPSFRGARTTVEVDLDVTPFVELEPLRDRYRMEVRDAAGTRVYARNGEVAVGDLRVTRLE